MRGLAARHDGLVQTAVVLGAVALYEALRLAVTPDWPLALDHAHGIAVWERRAHLAWEAPLQQRLLGMPALVGTLNAFYLAAHFLGTGLFFVWLYRRSPPVFRRFRDGFLIATALALLVAWRFPTAPPRAAGLGLVDTLRRFSGLDIGSPGSGGLTDPVAAMPSLHVGWAVGVAAGIALCARPLATRLLAPLYPLAVVVTVIATGNHFVADALAGALVMALGLGAAAFVERARSGRMALATRGGAAR